MRHLLTFACALITTFTRSQPLPDNFQFEQISVPGTVLSSLTEDIAQDEYGMLWLAKDVVYRYNGRDFRKYNTIFPDSTTFDRREVTKLFWDKAHHRLLIGTRNNGVLQYHYATDKLVRLPSKESHPIINDIVQTADGTTWVSSFSSGLYQLQNDTLVRWTSSKKIVNPTQLLVSRGQLWIAALGEVLVVRKNGIQKSLAINGWSPDKSRPVVRATALTFDTQGHLWVGTERHGLFEIDTASSNVLQAFPATASRFYNAISRLAVDKDGLLWIGTKGEGLLVYHRATGNFVTATRQENGLVGGNFYTSIFIDNSNIVWAGTAGPINKFDRTKIKFEHHHHEPYNPNSISDNIVRNVYEDRLGQLYICTTGGTLNIMNRGTGAIQRVKVTLPGHSNLITPLCVSDLDQQNLLVGTSTGLLQFNKANKKFSYYKPLKSVTEGKQVRHMVRQNDSWAFALRGNLLLFNMATGQHRLYNSDQGFNNVACVQIDTLGRTWAAVNRVVFVREATTGNLQRLQLPAFNRPDSSYFLTLSMQQIGSEMWVNTFNYGIFVLNVSESPVRILRHITAKDGLPGNSAYAALPDSRGFVWIPHNSGLSRYQPQNNQFIHFSVSEGLQDEEFNRLAFFKNHQGEIILGGINGINIFDPEKLVVPETELNLRLVGVRTLEVQSRGVQKSFYHPFGNEATVLSLPSGQNYLQFDFFPVSYREPARYTLSYRLEPFEKNWVATEDFTSHAYVNLAPGSYTFSVRAQSYDGEERTATVQFNIQTPYWKTWWFMLLTAGITSFLVFTIIYARVKNSRAETEKLTALLNERTREIQNSREELENLNRKKDFIFSILSHDLRSPLTTLKGFLSLLIENTEVISKDELRRHAIAIRNSVTNSLDLIDNTLFWSLSQTGNIQCKPQPVVLQPILEKIKGLYQLTAEKKKINLMLPPVEAVAVADENMLYVVLRNLVSNALKFTPEGKSVFVTCSTQHTRTFIRVRDEGIGMTPEEVGKIFSLSQPHIKKGTGSEKGTGLGLLLCKKFIDQNGGMLEIESEPGQGSTFTVSLPAA